jgi:hypothetical protein
MYHFFYRFKFNFKTLIINIKIFISAYSSTHNAKITDNSHMHVCGKP